MPLFSRKRQSPTTQARPPAPGVPQPYTPPSIRSLRTMDILPTLPSSEGLDGRESWSLGSMTTTVRPSRQRPNRLPLALPASLERWWYPLENGGWTTDRRIAQPHYCGQTSPLRVHCRPEGLALPEGMAADAPLVLSRTHLGGWIAEFAEGIPRGLDTPPTMRGQMMRSMRPVDLPNWDSSPPHVTRAPRYTRPPAPGKVETPERYEVLDLRSSHNSTMSSNMQPPLTPQRPPATQQERRVITSTVAA